MILILILYITFYTHLELEIKELYQVLKYLQQYFLKHLK